MCPLFPIHDVPDRGLAYAKLARESSLCGIAAVVATLYLCNLAFIELRFPVRRPVRFETVGERVVFVLSRGAPLQIGQAVVLGVAVAVVHAGPGRVNTDESQQNQAVYLEAKFTLSVAQAYREMSVPNRVGRKHSTSGRVCGVGRATDAALIAYFIVGREVDVRERFPVFHAATIANTYWERKGP